MLLPARWARPLSVGISRQRCLGLAQPRCIGRPISPHRVFRSSGVASTPALSSTSSPARQSPRLPLGNSMWQGFWASLGFLATLGSMGTALAALMGWCPVVWLTQTHVLGLAMALPLVAFMASARRESLVLQASQHQLAWVSAAGINDSSQLLEEMRQRMEDVQAALQGQASSAAKLGNLEARLSGMEGALLSSGRSLREASGTLAAVPTQLLRDQREQSEALAAVIRNELRRALEQQMSNSQSVSNLTARLMELGGSVNAANASQSEAMQQMAGSFNSAMSDMGPSLQAVVRQEIDRGLEPVQRLPAYLSTALQGVLASTLASALPGTLASVLPGALAAAMPVPDPVAAPSPIEQRGEEWPTASPAPAHQDPLDGVLRDREATQQLGLLLRQEVLAAVREGLAYHQAQLQAQAPSPVQEQAQEQVAAPEQALTVVPTTMQLEGDQWDALGKRLSRLETMLNALPERVSSMLEPQLTAALQAANNSEQLAAGLYNVTNEIGNLSALLGGDRQVAGDHHGQLTVRLERIALALTELDQRLQAMPPQGLAEASAASSEGSEVSTAAASVHWNAQLGQLREQLSQQLDQQLQQYLREQQAVAADSASLLQGAVQQLEQQLGQQLGQLDERLGLQLGQRLEQQVGQRLRQQLEEQLERQLGRQLEQQRLGQQFEQEAGGQLVARMDASADLCGQQQATLSQLLQELRGSIEALQGVLQEAAAQREALATAHAPPSSNAAIHGVPGTLLIDMVSGGDGQPPAAVQGGNGLPSRSASQAGEAHASGQESTERGTLAVPEISISIPSPPSGPPSAQPSAQPSTRLSAPMQPELTQGRSLHTESPWTGLAGGQPETQLPLPGSSSSQSDPLVLARKQQEQTQQWQEQVQQEREAQQQRTQQQQLNQQAEQQQQQEQQDTKWQQQQQQQDQLQQELQQQVQQPQWQQQQQEQDQLQQEPQQQVQQQPQWQQQQQEQQQQQQVQQQQRQQRQQQEEQQEQEQQLLLQEQRQQEQRQQEQQYLAQAPEPDAAVKPGSTGFGSQQAEGVNVQGRAGYDEQMEDRSSSAINLQGLSDQEVVAEGLRLLRAGREETVRGQDWAAADTLLRGAASAFQYALQLSPDDARALGNSGNALLAQGELKQLYLQALQTGVPPTTPQEQLIQSQAEAALRGEAQGLLTRAGELFKAVLQLEGWSSRALVNWGRAMCMRAELTPDRTIVEKLYRAALDKFEAVLEEEPGMISARYRAALAMMGLAQCSPNSRDALVMLTLARNYLQELVAAAETQPEAAALLPSTRAALQQAQQELNRGRW